MDRFELSPDDLRGITTPLLCIGISSDLLYLPSEVQEIARTAPNATYWELESPHGHDAFLLETARLEAQVKAFLKGLDS